MNLTDQSLVDVAASQTPNTTLQSVATWHEARCSRRGWLATAGSALLLAGCGGGVATVESPGPALAYRVPMRDDEGHHQLVTAHIDGKAVQLVLDSGADFNMLTPDSIYNSIDR